MKYILDTDTLIYFLKGQINVVKTVGSIAPEEISTTIINYTELLFGAFNSVKKKQNLQRIEEFLNKLVMVPFGKESAHIFAEQKAFLKKQGNIIADLDLMIASIVLQHQAILVTNNIKHFARIKKLKIENWCV